MKVCSKCGQRKSHKEFQANRQSPDGKRPDCKECCAVAGQEYRKRERQAIAARKKAAYEKNKQRVMEQHREYLARNPNKARDYYRKYRKRNRERIAAWWKTTPRGRFGVLLKLGLKRRPTREPITVDGLMELWREQDNRCAVTGVKMTWRQGQTLPNSISIDRIDSTEGYTRKNVRLVCYQVNCFKGRWSDGQMLEMAKAVVCGLESK